MKSGNDTGKCNGKGDCIVVYTTLELGRHITKHTCHRVLAAYIMIVAHNNSNGRKCGKIIGRKGMVVKIGAIIVVTVLTVTIQYCNFGHCHTRPQARSFRKWEP